MVTNVGFAVLDAQVVAGRADEVVVGTLTHARALEEAAALGGGLRHLGVVPGVLVVIDLDDDVDAVLAALATARIGGVVTTREDPAAPVALVSSASSVSAADRVRVVRGPAVTDPDLAWSVMIRAGRSDPAPCEVLDPDAAYSPSRSVADQLALLTHATPPHAPAALRRLLGV